MFINIKNYLMLFFIITFVYLSTSIFTMLLPKNGIDIKNQDIFINKQSKNIHLENIFDTTKGNRENKRVNFRLLDNIKLLAIYDLGTDGGYIVLKENLSAKTFILGKNEFYKGFKLIKVLKEFALFEKEEKNYKLPLSIDKKYGENNGK